MKKTIKKFEVKEINNVQTVKGGGIGRGDRNSSGNASTKAELL